MKILVIHASAGAGHFKAAEAVHDGIRSATDHDVVLVDALDHTSPVFKKLYKGIYTFLVTHVPWLWAAAFRLLDVRWLQGAVRPLRRFNNRLNAGRLHKFLIERQFDHIISTHFMPTEVACALKRKGLIRSKVITVVTDYDVHRIWTAAGNDLYAVGSDLTKRRIEDLGVESYQVFVTGIPVHQKFLQSFDVAELKKRFGLMEDTFTVLIATGSFGIGPIEEIVQALKGFQLIVVCGHNKNLYAHLSARQIELVKIFGLVDNMHELMAVADAMVTKPGGLSIAEALVSQLPMVFFNAIPGQESNNVEILRKYGIGVSGISINEMAAVLEKYRSSRDAYHTALNKIRALAKPSAVRDIIQLIQ